MSKPRSDCRGTLAGLLAFALAVGACGDDEEPNGPIEPTTGSVEVSVTTGGDGIDPDGYLATLDGAQDQALSLEDTVTFVDVDAGDHEVELTGLAAHCAAAGSNPRTVAVIAGAVASTTFTVTCAELVLSNQIVAYRQGLGVYAMDADGSNLFRIVSGLEPDVSRDGRKIVYDSGRDIWAANADGSGETQLTIDPAVDSHPSWSPDGTRVAFASERDGSVEIWVMNADGTGQVQLTDDPAGSTKPAWSPDGTRIAFNGGFDILLMNPDGSDVVNLTETLGGGFTPAWSPDGTRIAFVSGAGGLDVYIMNSDGSGRVQVTEDPAPDLEPTWSPDGLRLAFASERDGDFEIYTIAVDGTGLTRLTDDPADDRTPVWSP
jgi:tricorn protease-like protein